MPVTSSSIAQKMSDTLDDMLTEHNKGTKIGKREARKISLKITDLCKEYRAVSVEEDKKA